MQNPHTIIESEIGPLISHSRSSVYDVMEAYNNGNTAYQISIIYNLSPLQVETALEYISEHRERLSPELSEILQKKAERERYYNTIAAEIQKKINQKPVTPERAVFYAWREKNRHRRSRTNYPQGQSGSN